MSFNNLIYYKDFPKHFEDFVEVESNTFSFYTLPLPISNKTNNPNITLNPTTFNPTTFNPTTFNITLNNSFTPNNSLSDSLFIQNSYTCQGLKLKILRFSNAEINIFHLEDKIKDTLINEIVKELKKLNYTHLYYINEVGPFYDSNTFTSYRDYVVYGYSIKRDKDDGIEKLNTFIKNKKWYKDIEPFYVLFDNENKLKDNDSSGVFGHEKYLTFNRLCAWHVYEDKINTFDENKLIKMDLYLIETINHILEEYNVKNILFKKDINKDIDLTNDILYKKINNKWIKNPEFPIQAITNSNYVKI